MFKSNRAKANPRRTTAIHNKAKRQKKLNKDKKALHTTTHHTIHTTSTTNTSSLHTTAQRNFRFGSTLGLGGGFSFPKPTPYSISSRFRKGDDENGEDSGLESSSSSAEEQHAMVPVPIGNGETTNLSKQHIADAVQNALNKVAGAKNGNFAIDPSKIEVLTIEEARARFHNPQDSDFEGIDLNDLSDTPTIGNTTIRKILKNKKADDGVRDAPIMASLLSVNPFSATSNATPTDTTTAKTTTTSSSTSLSGSQPQVEVMSLLDQSRAKLSKLSSPEIVAHLDSHVIAQDEAKKALAIAVRNRERRFRLGQVGKPDAISNIEEIGIRLAQKHGYKLRQELFSQIGRPTLYDPKYDPNLMTPEELLAQAEGRTIERGATTTTTTSTTNDDNSKKKGKKKDIESTTLINTAITNNTTTTNPTSSTTQSTVKDYLLDRQSNLTLDQTVLQNAKLLQNNKQYGAALAKEVNPFNILMVGPTGSGKTELVKRLCTLLEAPYVHADATRYTETGVVGTDIDQILVDLYKDALDREKKMEMVKIRPLASKRAVASVVNALRGNDALYSFLEKKGLNLMQDFDEQMKQYSAQQEQQREAQLSHIPKGTDETIGPYQSSPGGLYDAVIIKDQHNAQFEQKGAKGKKKTTTTTTTTDDKSTTSTAANTKATPKTTPATTTNKNNDKSTAGATTTPKTDTKSLTKAKSNANDKSTPATTTPAATTTITRAKAEKTKVVAQKIAEDPKSINTLTKSTKSKLTTTPVVDTKPTKKGGKGKSTGDDDLTPVKVTAKTIDESAKGKKGGKKTTTPETTSVDTTNTTTTTTTKGQKAITTAATTNDKTTTKKPTTKKSTKKQPTESDIEADSLINEAPATSAKRPATKAKQPIKKGRGEEEYLTPPGPNDKKIRTTKFDQDASGLFSTDVDDESTVYNKKIRPMMFDNMAKKYLDQPANPNADGTTKVVTNDATIPTNQTSPRTYIPTFDDLKQWVKAGHLDDFVADIPLPVPTPPKSLNSESNNTFTIEEIMGNNSSKKEKVKMKNRRVTVAYALEQLIEHHCQDMVKEDELHERALKNCEQNGVVFIDEIDKLVSSQTTHTTTSASKGDAVQRELLSLLQGKVVKRNGLTIQTENILFICAGAFHHASPAQLLPELQGRLPVITKLNPLTQVQLALVLTLPVYSILKQYMTLMKADGIDIKMDDEAIWEMSKAASELNERTMNLGARRLHNIVNSVFGYISYNYANGLRLEVDALGRLKTITSNDMEMESSLRQQRLSNINSPNDQQEKAMQQKMHNSKQTANTLNMSIPIDPSNIDILPNGETSITITKEYIQKTLKHMMDKVDISRFLL